MSKRRVFFETREVIQKTRRGYIDLEMDYFQFYSVAFKHIASLSSSCSKDFILWVMGKVDENNNFTFSKELYEQFNADLAKILKPKTYAAITVKTCLAELIENQIIFRKSRGEYTVNPKLFWTEEISERVKQVKMIESETRKLPPGAVDALPVFTDEELNAMEKHESIPVAE